MAEVQRDNARKEALNSQRNARASAKAIVLDLIEEMSAMPSEPCWLYTPTQFKLAVIARLEKWQ
jgi:hypothetical protein